jgi:hypothetical protein
MKGFEQRTVSEQVEHGIKVVYAAHNSEIGSSSRRKWFNL